MLDLKLFLTDYYAIKKAFESRNLSLDLPERVRVLTERKYDLMKRTQTLEAERNRLSKLVGQARENVSKRDGLLAEVNEVKELLRKMQAEEAEVTTELDQKALFIPNLPHPNTPLGKDESENVVLKEHAKLGRGLVTGVKPHYEVAVKLNIVDFDRAVKMSGARFWSYRGLGSKLVRALINFMLETHIAHGYEELTPPVLVKASAMQGTGQLPKFYSDLFKVVDSDLFLIPTAEVPVTNFFSGEIVDLATPIALTAYTLSFRSESGSGGRDMKGLIRSHQFHKVELVKIVTDEQIEREYKAMLGDAKRILELLKLPYREVHLCSGDLGFSAEETVDLEVWIPSENRYREISSVSRFGSFQARRLGIRYKNVAGQNQYAATLNGSGLAIDRTIAAILENYQNTDGSITIPDVLQPFMGLKAIKVSTNKEVK